MNNPYEPPQTTEPPCPFCSCDNCKVGWFLIAMAITAGLVWVIALGLDRIGKWRYLNAGEVVSPGDQVNLFFTTPSKDPRWSPAGWEYQGYTVIYGGEISPAFRRHN